MSNTKEKFIEFGIELGDSIAISLLQTLLLTKHPYNEPYNRKGTSQRRGHPPLALPVCPIAFDIQEKYPCIVLQVISGKHFSVEQTEGLFPLKLILTPCCQLYRESNAVAIKKEEVDG